MHKSNKEQAIDGVVLATSDHLVWITTEDDELAVAAAATFGKVRPKDGVRIYLLGADPEEIYLAAKSPDAPPRTRNSLAAMYENKEILQGTVSQIVKGGFNVDIGVSSFLPFSRSGAKNQAEMERLVGREILCTIIEFEADNIVVDRRNLLEEADSCTQRWRLDELKVGERVRGTVRTLTDFGAFIDLGGIDGLVHASDISLAQGAGPSGVLSLGQEVDALVERIDPRRRRVGLSLKALDSDPWAKVGKTYLVGDKVVGTITTVTDFGYFVELEPGVEGLAYKASGQPETLKQGIKREFTIVSVNQAERRIGLACDAETYVSWKDIETLYPVGSTVTGKITTITQFGAFVALGGGIEALIHVGDISHTWIKHPKDVLKPGMEVRAQVLLSDSQRRRLHLGLKQLEGTKSGIAAPLALPQSLDAPNTERRDSDFTLYSKSIFVNWPEASRRETLNAILFAIIDAGFLPRMATEQSHLVKVVRECQYGVHEVSNRLELGVFLGCQEYGGDIHRQKRALLLSEKKLGKLADEDVVTYKTPAEAVKCFISWLEETGGVPVGEHTETWTRYECFLVDLPGMSDSLGVSVEAPSVSQYLAVARQWLRTCHSLK